jgi:hypothetical protein
VKVSKRDREMAALIMSIVACEGGWAQSNLLLAADALGIVNFSPTGQLSPALDLAYEAMSVSGVDAEGCAEAEALIRCGWSPS